MELDFNNETLEKLLLKKALADKKWTNILSNVYDRRWFKTPYIGLVIQLVLKYYGKYSSIPNTQVISAMVKKYEEVHREGINSTDVQSMLLDVQRMNLNMDETALNSNLKEFIRRNAFYNALWDNSELLEKSPESYEKVVDKCLENFDRVQRLTFNDTDIGMDYFDQNAMSRHWEYINNPEAKISTGWQALDTYTNGGFLKDGRSLYLIMAQAGLGKSVFLSNLAVNFLKQNLSVVVVSLEMSEDVYAMRFDAHISNSNVNRLKENEETAVQRIRKFHEDHPDSKLYIKEYPPRSITCNDIQAYLENLRNAGHKVDVIIVDYLNLLKSSIKTDNMFMDGLEVSEKLRALSYTSNCPVISAVQCNSEGMNNKDIGMENISQSRGIAHTADFLMALYQPQEDRESGRIQARLLKNRLGGRVGTSLTFQLNPDTLNLQDLSFDPDVVQDQAGDEISKTLIDLEDASNDLNSLQ